MKKKIGTIFKKVTRINDVALDSMAHDEYSAIIKKFTDVGIEIFAADFGFAWWKYDEEEEYSLVYKSSTTPYEPTRPREGAGNSIARKNKKPFFDSDVKKENYLFNINEYLKSYIIIPIFYNDLVYGNLVLCYKKKHIFSEDELDLATILGNTTAQTITIRHYIEKEYEAIKKAELLKDTKRLLQEEKLKTEFLANATHELRTPVAIIKGNVDLALINKGKKLKSTQSVLRAIDEETKHLSKILSDLTLITTRKENLKNKLVIEEIHLKELIVKVAQRFKVMAQKKNISFILSKIPDISIKGDRTYLEKILSNLIKNSIMYGNTKGHTRINITISGKNIMIHVEDDGVGIPDEDLPYIFERFYRADKSHKSDGNSTGLGLAIVKWATEVHGGVVTVKKLKKGTQFTISLPR